MDVYQKIKNEIDFFRTTGNELFDNGKLSGLKMALVILDQERAILDYEDIKEIYGIL